MLEGEVDMGGLAKSWVVSYAGNLAGSVMLAAMAVYAGLFAGGQPAVPMSVAKTSMAFGPVCAPLCCLPHLRYALCVGCRTFAFGTAYMLPMHLPRKLHPCMHVLYYAVFCVMLAVECTPVAHLFPILAVDRVPWVDEPLCQYPHQRLLQLHQSLSCRPW